MKKFLLVLCGLLLAVSLTVCGEEPTRSTPGPVDSGGMGNVGSSQSEESGGRLEPSRAESFSQAEEPAESAAEAFPEDSDTITSEEENTMKLRITVGGRAFSTTLYDNEAARALAEMLPMTLPMEELNGNEKYFYLDRDLPSDPSVPQGIRTGDLMLYGPDCLVLFYESFSTSYGYTPLGAVDDPAGLAEALGGGSVQAGFAWE